MRLAVAFGFLLSEQAQKRAQALHELLAGWARVLVAQNKVRPGAVFLVVEVAGHGEVDRVLVGALSVAPVGLLGVREYIGAMLRNEARCEQLRLRACVGVAYKRPLVVELADGNLEFVQEAAVLVEEREGLASWRLQVLLMRVIFLHPCLDVGLGFFKACWECLFATRLCHRD